MGTLDSQLFSTDGVRRFEGTLNQYTGDGIMALFGAPIAHEDHAQRACYAALHLRDELRRYADELRRNEELNFSVRMGVNSGEVVVGRIGDDLRMDYTAQGHTVGLAARMEGLAAADQVYVTEHTAALVAGYFELRDLGPFRIKGVCEPITVFALEGVGALRTRLDRSRARGFSRFVGRGDELRVLEAALERAERGRGQAVGIVAEAGVGKSRLCYEFLQVCRARGRDVFEAHAVAHGRSIPLLPIIELLRQFFRISERDDDQAAREKIAGRLLLLDDRFREFLPLLFEFLAVPDPARPAPHMDPAARQRQLFALTRQLVQAPPAERDPTVLLIEDLHWLDPATEAFIETMMDAVSEASLLLLWNFRPEYHAGWMSKPSYQQIALAPLGPDAVRELVADRLGNDPSLDGLASRIEARTRGNPFFTEEVIQSLIELGALQGSRGSYRLARPVAEVEVPPAVQALLAARIDRLVEREKLVLQTAAVIGKNFQERVLARCLDLAEVEIADALRVLRAAEFVYEEAIYPEVEYTFKHPLTQEVAYRSQLASRRERTHERVARTVEAMEPAERLDEKAALLAYH